MEGYEVLIVGAGFAGSEAAYRLAQKGVRVGLLTQSLDSVMMPFLPPRPPFPEGSLLAKAYDPGDPRLWAFHARAKYLLEREPNLHLFQATATELLLEGDRVVGVATWEGPPAKAPRVVLAVGSFLGARLRMGEVEEEAGRLSEASYPDLFLHLQALGFRFLKREREVPQTPGTPGYTVSYQAFHPEEWEEATFRLTRLKGLYAVGLCVREGEYALMSQEGLRLAEHLLHELG
ncbi:tRNA uridine 5-carboxymethylaminomethyl modification protein GidA [Thermus scotoductus]|uniref:tRNA uridine 5-carboxymethylaminomethyl modification protein GidA n=1 Tax=Thermus scotoductus TaxID=37636 RepID=A0A430V6Z0_THESC|nr:FAD-dependent oxidoreductase [Thermus scotoductus]RTI02784.1 tRNA uridine 5-carboxymethylaminomethyl modification protein GidA [Thermus scotoductus]RTI20840.1 tRNA uridine 5-carboxymethylaminomethyl modification protein GidA [Thermus scotoductus]